MTGQPIFEITSSLEDELKMIRGIIAMWPRYQNYTRRLPPSVEADIQRLIDELTPDEITTAILSDNKIKKTPIENLKHEFQQHSALIHDFLNRFNYEIPTRLGVHITQYGPGGSYHPLGQHPLSEHTPTISVLDPLRAKEMGKSRMSFPMTLVHEAIHLIIYDPVTKKLSEDLRIRHRRNEALVDQLCSCDELRPIMGTYPKQQNFMDSLMPNWNELISWKNPPSWTA